MKAAVRDTSASLALHNPVPAKKTAPVIPIIMTMTFSHIEKIFCFLSFMLRFLRIFLTYASIITANIKIVNNFLLFFDKFLLFILMPQKNIGLDPFFPHFFSVIRLQLEFYL